MLKFNPFTGNFDLVGENSGASDYPISNNLYSFKANDTKSSQSIPLDLLVTSKIYIPFDFTLSTLYLRYGASVVGASVLGMYNIGEDGLPSDLIIQTTAFNTSLTASQGKFITPTVFKKGYYAVVYHSNVTNSIWAFANASTFPNWGSTSTILSINVYATITVALTYTGTLPEVFPTGALSVTVSAPYIIFRE